MRAADREGRAAPEGEDRLLGHDHRADGDQALAQVVAVDGPDDDRLEEPARDEAEGDRGEVGRRQRQRVQRPAVRRQPAAEAGKHGGRDEGPEADEGGMAEVQDVHQPEDEAEPRGHQEQHHPHGEPRDGQRHPGRGRADQQEGHGGDREGQQVHAPDAAQCGGKGAHASLLTPTGPGACPEARCRRRMPPSSPRARPGRRRSRPCRARGSGRN